MGIKLIPRIADGQYFLYAVYTTMFHPCNKLMIYHKRINLVLSLEKYDQRSHNRIDCVLTLADI
jgi:hypothetical protein